MISPPSPPTCSAQTLHAVLCVLVDVRRDFQVGIPVCGQLQFQLLPPCIHLHRWTCYSLNKFESCSVEGVVKDTGRIPHCCTILENLCLAEPAVVCCVFDNLVAHGFFTSKVLMAEWALKINKYIFYFIYFCFTRLKDAQRN